MATKLPRFFNGDLLLHVYRDPVMPPLLPERYRSNTVILPQRDVKRVEVLHDGLPGGKNHRRNLLRGQPFGLVFGAEETFLFHQREILDA